MKREYSKYFDKLFSSFIDWVFRKKSLNYILLVVVLFTLRELTAIGAGESITQFVEKVQKKNPEGWLYWLAEIGELVFGQGSYIVLIISLILILAIVLIKRTELIQATSGENFQSIIRSLEEKNKTQQGELKNLELSQEQLELKRNELTVFLDKVNDTLQSKNISKEELIQRMANKLKAILIYKSFENTPKTIRDKVYPDLGVQNVSSGLSIIPPQKLDQNLSDKRLIEWFKSEIDERLPDDYEFNFSLIAVVDLTKMSVYKKLEPYRRFNRTYLDKLRIEDLLSMREIESYLYREEKLSSKDIIEIPNITFLIDGHIVSKEEIEKLFKNNDTIIQAIKEKVGSQQLKTTDFATITDETIINAISNYVSDPEEVTQIIKSNSLFWKNYFEKKI